MRIKHSVKIKVEEYRSKKIVKDQIKGPVNFSKKTKV